MVVGLVVDITHIGKGFQDQVQFEAHHGGNAQVLPERLGEVFHLLLHDRAAIAQGRQWFGKGAAETSSHAGRKDHCLNCHVDSSETVRTLLSEPKA